MDFNRQYEYEHEWEGTIGQYDYSPLNIMMLLELHCFTAKLDVTSLNGTPASKDSFARLLDDNMITMVDRPSGVPGHGFRTTDRGKALIRKWGAVNLPVLEEKWI